jgi:hypothetical protein
MVLWLAGGSVLAAEPTTLEEGGSFDVRSAYLEPSDHVYHLNATLDLAFSRAAAQALRDGVPVVVELDLDVDRRRSLLPDARVASLVQRWQVSYHALSERYLINNLNNGEQASYASLADALGALSDVRRLPVVEESKMPPGGHFEASVRVIASIEGGLPSALKTMMFWMDWKRTSEWYTWTVRL